MFAQNFATVVTDEDRYFLNSDSLNIGLRVVETDTVSDGVIFQFYPDLRPTLYGDGTGCVPDTNCNGYGEVYYRFDGAGWMGKEVLARNDGLDVYFNLNDDSIFVKTDAVLNDAWTVFDYGNDTVITGSVVQISQGSSINPNENVKTILLQAMTQGVPVYHPLNGVEWKLSEDNGWQAVHSLYWFPDFPLPETQEAYGCLLYYGQYDPGHEQYDTAIHELTDFQPLKVSEMFPLQVGDVFQIREGNTNWAYNPMGFRYTTYTVSSVQQNLDSMVVSFSTEWFNDWNGVMGSDTETVNLGSLDAVFPGNAVSGHDLMIIGERPHRTYMTAPASWYPFNSETDISTLFNSLKSQCSSYVVSTEWETNVFPVNSCGVFYSQADYTYGIEYWLIGIPFSAYSKGGVGGLYERIPTYISTENCQFGTLQYLGVEEVDGLSLTLYPNPTQNHISFQTVETGILLVLDLSGRTVLSSIASKGKNTVDVESLPGGIYFLRLESDQAVSSARFMKN